MPDLSILIPARNEMWLEATIRDIFAHAKADTEVIVVLDGTWPDEPLFDHPKLRVTHSAAVIGQRAATNLAASMSRAEFVMKLDAHCSLDDGFDVKLIAANRELGRPDLTQIPAMVNLHVFNWKCRKCGRQTYQGPTPTKCETNKEHDSELDTMPPACGSTDGFDRVVVWQPRKRKAFGNGSAGRGSLTRTEFWRFDHELHFQYWSSYADRPAAKGELVDVMSSIGACFFMRRDRFQQIGGLDEAHGSWGQFGTEIACKSWLSGGRHIVNKRTWFSHLFRTQGGDFGMPYPLGNAAVQVARAYSQQLWRENRWSGAVQPLSWLLEKFGPVPDWTPERVDALPKTLRADGGPVPPRQAIRVEPQGVETFVPTSSTPTKGLAYYSDLKADPAILETVRGQIREAAPDLPLVSATLGRLDFGTNLVPRACRVCGYIEWASKRRRTCLGCTTSQVDVPLFDTLERGYLTMFRQQLAALEALDTNVAFMVEHDVLYDPSHFDFTPPDDTTFYYNQHTWRVHAETGQAIFYYCNQVSGLCASRALLVEHYRRIVAHVEQHGFDRSLGFEPGGNKQQQALDPHPVETWMSAGCNVDIKSGACLTKWRGSPAEFRNQDTCRGWQASDRVPGWGVTQGRFSEFLADVARGLKETAA